MSDHVDQGHISPAAPVDRKWRKFPIWIEGCESHAYLYKNLKVISSAENVEYRGLFCPHNHVSVSVAEDRRPTDEEMDIVRRDFDMEDAEEDNHFPGRIRNLFLPLHLPRGTTGVCDCKSDETTVVENDGFTWSKEKIHPCRIGT